MKKVVIFGANGKIARIVTNRILTEPAFNDIQLTLALRNHHRLDEIANNRRVILKEADLKNQNDVNSAVENQDIVFIATVDSTITGLITRNVIKAMHQNHVNRVISTNILGIYNEVPGEFGKWNRQQIPFHGLGLAVERRVDTRLAKSGLSYTTLRLPWLNDRDEVQYTITHRHEPYIGVSASRQSVADVILKIIRQQGFGENDSLGIADPNTAGENRPVK